MKEDNYAKIAQIYKALYGEAMFGVPQIKQLEINRNICLCVFYDSGNSFPEKLKH